MSLSRKQKRIQPTEGHELYGLLPTETDAAAQHQFCPSSEELTCWELPQFNAFIPGTRRSKDVLPSRMLVQQHENRCCQNQMLKLSDYQQKCKTFPKYISRAENVILSSFSAKSRWQYFASLLHELMISQTHNVTFCFHVISLQEKYLTKFWQQYYKVISLPGISVTLYVGVRVCLCNRFSLQHQGLDWLSTFLCSS